MILNQISKKIKKFLFEMLMGSLRKSANLEVSHVSLNVGHVTFLDNGKKSNKDDEALIFIHGLGSDKDTWLQLIKCLTKRYRIIVPDLPGHGDSIQDLCNNYSIEAQAQHIIELLKTLNIKRAHFIGSSMGGAVAIKLSYIQPEIVLSLILIDSYGVIKTPSYIHNLVEETGHNPMLEVNSRDDYKTMLSLAMVNPPFIPGFMLDVLVENMKEKMVLNKKILKDSESDSDLSYLLPKLKPPSLVIWGAEDNVLHVDNADVFSSKLNDCRKVVIEKTGHVPMVEEPKITATYITEFINDIT
jgi:abhydrolase domain-containing protein 6